MSQDRDRWRTCLFRRCRKTSIAISLALTLLSLGRVCQAAEDQQAREVVARVSRLFVSQSSIATVEMQITKDDWQRKISMQFWSLGESNILVRIRRPQEDAGTAILKSGTKIWYYLPKANRTMKMPASMMTTSWMGSDFTLNDLVKESRLTNDYEIATSFEGQRDGIALSEYTLTPRPAAAVVWGKIILEIRQADHMPIRQRYYDEDGKLVRVLNFSGYKSVSGRLMPTCLVMQSPDQAAKKAGASGGVLAQGVMRPSEKAGEQTTITYEKIVFDEPISAGTFSLENLKQ